jgi:hypothetical protein
MSDEEKEPDEPGCPSCTALGRNCGGHWNVRPRGVTPNQTRGRASLDVIDGDYDHDAFYRDWE